MTDSEATLKDLRRALRREPRLDFDHQPISLTFANGELLLSGEVDDIAAKRLPVERAARVTSVTAVFDELRVRPAESIPDDEIRDLLRKALVEEPALTGCTIREHARGRLQIVHAPLTSVGRTISPLRAVSSRWSARSRDSPRNVSRARSPGGFLAPGM